MTLEFFKQAATPNRVDKSAYLTRISERDNVVLKADTNLMQPTFILKTSADIYKANYVYCSFTGRYYYIISIDALSGGRVAVNCRVDVLHTYKNEIKNSSAWVVRSDGVEDSSDDYDMLHNDFPFRADYMLKGCDLENSHTPFTGQTVTRPIVMVIK